MFIIAIINKPKYLPNFVEWKYNQSPPVNRAGNQKSTCPLQKSTCPGLMGRHLPTHSTSIKYLSCETTWEILIERFYCTWVWEKISPIPAQARRTYIWYAAIQNMGHSVWRRTQYIPRVSAFQPVLSSHLFVSAHPVYKCHENKIYNRFDKH